jgi:hypothetical protein
MVKGQKNHNHRHKSPLTAEGPVCAHGEEKTTKPKGYGKLGGVACQ